jgi:peptide deformylase
MSKENNISIPMEPTLRELVTYPSPILSQKCDEVQDDEFGTTELEQLCLDMFYTMKINEGVGLAANQIGINKRIAVLSIPDNIVLINPVLVSSRGEIKLEEGCLSVPRIFEKVTRAEEVVVVYQDTTGKRCEIVASGMKAVALQHEIDHLDGIVFIDRLSKLRKMRAKVKANKIKNKSS